MGNRQSSRVKASIPSDEKEACSSSSAVSLSQLILACSKGDKRTIQAYIKNGGNINVRNSIGQTPLLAATLENQVQIVNILLDNGAKDIAYSRNQVEDNNIVINLEDDNLDEEFRIQTSFEDHQKPPKVASNQVQPTGDSAERQEKEKSNSLEIHGIVHAKSTEAYTVGDVVIFTKTCIGKGAFASVFEGELNGQKCAVKLLYGLANEIQLGLPVADNIQAKSLSRFQKENEQLKSLKHPNIVKHLDTIVHPETGHLLIALELMDCNLRHFFSPKTSSKNLSRQALRRLCYDISSGIEYIHSNEIVHRDLCSDNILLDCKPPIPVAKICDFGMSKKISTTDQSIYLVRYRHEGYLPPEAKLKESLYYDPSFDIFCIGVLIIQITQQLPNIETERQRKQQFSQIDNLDKMKPIIQKCLKEDMKKRPSAIQLKENIQNLLHV